MDNQKTNQTAPTAVITKRGVKMNFEGKSGMVAPAGT